MASAKWVFGLSIDETIEWRLCPTERQIDPETQREAVFLEESDEERGVLTEPPDGFRGELQLHLRAALEDAVSQRGSHFDDVAAVGVSMIGLVDRDKGLLTSLARKEWGKDGQPVLNFTELLGGLFPQVDEILLGSKPGKQPPPVNLHNDCTAKCLAEFRKAGRRKDPPRSIFYTMFEEGVNSAFVHDPVPLFTELNTEMGHIYPRPHPRDYDFDPRLSGCPVHHRCYEGMASAKRFKTQWTGVPPLPTEARELLAFYAAQMCFNGALIFSPEVIMVSGSAFDEDLLEDVRGLFDLFNSGGSTKPYLRYPAMENLQELIRPATIAQDRAGLQGALELARLTLSKPETALRDAWCDYSRYIPRGVQRA